MGVWCRPNSVIAQPIGAPNCATDGDTPTTEDVGYNFSDDTSCKLIAGTSNVKTPNDPALGALANNGGPTQTLLPLAGSPLLDVIPPAASAARPSTSGASPGRRARAATSVPSRSR